MPEFDQNNIDLDQLAANIKHWGGNLGFQRVSIIAPDLKYASEKLKSWLVAYIKRMLENMGVKLTQKKGTLVRNGQVLTLSM